MSSSASACKACQVLVFLWDLKNSRIHVENRKYALTSQVLIHLAVFLSHWVLSTTPSQ
jgi:hypothetical protein